MLGVVYCQGWMLGKYREVDSVWAVTFFLPLADETIGTVVSEGLNESRGVFR